MVYKSPLQSKNDHINKVYENKGKILEGEYVTNDSKMLHECIEGHTFILTPAQVKKGMWCDNCKPNKYAIECLNKIKNKGGEQLEKYIDMETKILVRCHNKHTFRITPHHIKSGSWCRKCYGTCPDEAKERFYKNVLDKSGEVLGEYINSKTKTRIKCCEGHPFDITPHDVKKGIWCHFCSGKSPILAAETTKKLIEEKNGEMLEKYINSITPILVKCSEGHPFKISPHSIKNGIWCHICSGMCPIVAAETTKKVIEEKGGEMLSDYINTHSEILIKCHKGHIFRSTPNRIKSAGGWCSICNESKGERAIRLFLTDKKITHNPQWTIYIDDSYVRYDFHLILDNKHIFIEFDGKQHFEYNDFFCKNINEFEIRKNNDFIKTKWAIENNFYLLRIDYKSIKNIDELLEEYFKFIENNDPFYLVSNEKMYSELNTKLSEYVTIFDLK